MKEYNTIIFGAGAWGTTIANLIANNLNKETILWCYESEVAQNINQTHENKIYLPGIKINKKVIACTDIPVSKANFIFLANPSQNIYDMLKKIYEKKEFREINKKARYIICSKGIDSKRKKLLSSLVQEFFPKSNISVLSGPTFARELAIKNPTAVTLANQNLKTGKEIANLLKNNYFRIYLNRDIIGVQLCGVLKNILAIAAGISDGLDLGKNARAAIIARGIKEIINIVKCFGGKEKTVIGLSGIGDIVLTCNSKSSRNFKYGYEIAKGLIKIDKTRNSQEVTEGFENIKSIFYFKKKFNIEAPIIEAVNDIVVGKKEFPAL